jgi:polysaccharide biosynthesis transport protein
VPACTESSAEQAKTPMSNVQTSTAPTLPDYFRVIRRRKWIIAACVVLLPLVALLLSSRQQEIYQGSSEVYLSPQNLAQALTNTGDASFFQDAERFAETQADLASVPEVAARVCRNVPWPQCTPLDLLADSEVEAKPNVDLLEFRVRNADAELAATLATEYAEQFRIYRREIDTEALKTALVKLEERIEQLEQTRGGTSSQLYASLVDKEQELRLLEALQTSNAFVVRPSTAAVQVQPKTTRNVILAIMFGLAFGLLFAFLWEALDTRLRSADEITERMRMPLLGRIPRPARTLQRANRLTMIEDPNSVQAEAFRMLRTNIDFVNLERDARTIMVTSALEQEGKSTTVANLAVAMAKAGRHVVLVDLDLRRPFVGRFFRLEGRPGITDVILGDATLEDALARLPIQRGEGETLLDGENGARAEGVLEVLPSGPTPPNTGEFVGTRSLARILEALKDRGDVVLIDAPPVLHVGDAMALSAVVDAMLVVARLRVVRRSTVDELVRLLETTPATKLGFVITDADLGEDYGVSYYYKYRPQALPRGARLAQRLRESASRR